MDLNLAVTLRQNCRNPGSGCGGLGVLIPCLAAAGCRSATQSLSQQRILNREHLALDIAASRLGAYNPLSSSHARRLSAQHTLTQRLVWPRLRLWLSFFFLLLFIFSFFFTVQQGKRLMKVSNRERSANLVPSIPRHSHRLAVAKVVHHAMCKQVVGEKKELAWKRWKIKQVHLGSPSLFPN